MKPCSVRLYLVVDHTKVLWLRPCFGIVVCCFGEQVFKIHVRPKQASVPSRHAPLLCQHSVVEGLWEGGGSSAKAWDAIVQRGIIVWSRTSVWSMAETSATIISWHQWSRCSLTNYNSALSFIKKGKVGVGGGGGGFQGGYQGISCFSFPLLTAQVESHLCLLLQVISMLCLDA